MTVDIRPSVLANPVVASRHLAIVDAAGNRAIPAWSGASPDSTGCMPHSKPKETDHGHRHPRDPNADQPQRSR